MTKPKNEAERLLNTIVSSRARLAAMRGDSVGSVEPSLEAEQPMVPPDERATEESVAVDDQALFNDLPLEDDHTDISGPSMVLGIPEPDSEDGVSEDDVSEGWSHLDQPAAPIADNTAPEQANLDDGPGPDEHSTEPDEEDPFSFIDLLPPPATDEPSDITPIEEPLSTPPPVRDRPLMPLPVTLANCAPQRTEASTFESQRPVQTPPTAAPEPDLELEPEPDHRLETAPEPETVQPEHGPVVIEDLTSAAELSPPRHVPPRVLDPDRSRLEVDVIVDEFADDEPLRFETQVPQLTTSSSIEPAAPSREPTPDATTLFDAVSSGFDSLRQGNVRAAMVHFSDALDWDPEQIDARLARGRCRRDLGDTVGAMSDFLQSQDHAPHSPDPHVEMGDLFFARKDYGRAIAHYDDALELHPEHAMALCRRGISHHHTRRPSQALEDLTEAARVDPTIPNINRYVRMVSPRR